MSIQLQLQKAYLDRWNNYYTDEVWAEHNDLTIEEATTILNLGAQIHEKLVARYKESKEYEQLQKKNMNKITFVGSFAK